MPTIDAAERFHHPRPNGRGNMRLTSSVVEMNDAFEAIETFYERGWSDGLPIVPPTENAVDRFLQAADLEPGHVLGTEPVKGGVATAEKVAINSIMAGCRPEYMPVITAAVEAITAEEFNLHAITASTMGASILVLISGPAVTELGVNSGISAFGPGHRANATIGRALRLIVMNLFGSRSGEIDKATRGHPGKYTWCFGESEDRSPWAPIHADMGLPADGSAVTLVSALSGLQVGEHAANSPEAILDAFVNAFSATAPGMSEVLVVLCPEHAAFFRDAGWPKSRVGEYLYEVTKRPATQWSNPTPRSIKKEVSASVSALERPESAIVTVAGGDGGGWSAVIPTWSNGHRSKVVTRPITMTANNS